jgi:hypothetical protein
MISLLLKLMWWVQRRRKEDELREELQFHLEEEADESRADGLLEDHARRAAYRDLGNVTLLREDTRTLWTWTFLEQFVQDVRHAIRTLRRSPSFAAVAVLTLALGIGATTAVYSVVSATLLRPLPYKDADRLVRIVENVPAEESPSGMALRTSAMKSDAYLWWRDQTKTLSSIAGIVASEVTAQINADLRRLSGARVSPSLFTMLGTPPLAGRGLDAGDEYANVAVLSAGAWARWFSSDPNVIGRNVVLDGVSHTIIGVMSTDFGFPSTQIDIWTPYVVEPNAPNRIITIDVVAKIRDNVLIAAVSTEANIIGNNFLGLPLPGTAGAPNPARFEVIGLQDHLVEQVQAGASRTHGVCSAGADDRMCERRELVNGARLRSSA